MSETAKHIPTPWFAGPTPGYLAMGQIHQGRAPITLRSAAHTEEICTVWTYLLPVEANAAFIVRACNSHDALVAALNNILDKAADIDEDLAGAVGRRFSISARDQISHRLSGIVNPARAALAHAKEQDE